MEHSDRPKLPPSVLPETQSPVLSQRHSSAASVCIDIPSSSTITNTIRRSYQHPTPSIAKVFQPHYHTWATGRSRSFRNTYGEPLVLRQALMLLTVLPVTLPGDSLILTRSQSNLLGNRGRSGRHYPHPLPGAEVVYWTSSN